MDHKTRCFLAIELSEKVKSEIVKTTQLSRKTQIPGVRWVDQGNLHLTLKFFGDLSDSQIQKVTEITSEVSINSKLFEIRFKGFGAFPSWSRPRIIWEGIEIPTELTDLYNNLDKNFLAAGFPSESRMFSPHLTLARVNERFDPSKNSPVIASLRSLADPKLGHVAIDHLTLFKSVLQPGGSVYTPIQVFHFLPVM